MVYILQPKDINVVILCGGMGTRLSKVISDRPKPMVEVKRRPFLDILVEYIAGFGFKRFILCTGYKSEFIEKYYQARGEDLSLLISKEDELLGTAGAIKKAEHLIHSSTFLAINGDSFCPIDMKNFVEFHIVKKALLSIVLAVMEKVSDYGTIKVNEVCRVVSFNEKAVIRGSALVNAGIYLFDRAILRLIPSGQKYSLEYNLFPSILHSDVYGYITDKEFIDIGTRERLEIAKEYLRKMGQST